MKKTIIGASTWALLPLVPLPWRTAGQEPVSLVVPDRLGIVVDTLAVLGDPEGPGILASENVYVTSDSRGHHFVFALPFPVIQEFDGEGRYVQSIGREGDGPGEFRWPQALHVDDAQRIHVADGVHQRVTRLAGDGSDPVELLRSMHFVSTDSLWVAPMDRYRVERWSLRGELRAVFLGDGSLSFDLEELAEVRGVRPRTVLSAVRQDASGLVWLKLHVPRDDWEEVARTGDEEELSGALLTDTLLEILDPASGTVVASRRLPGRHTRFFGDHQIGEVVIDPENLSVEVHVLSLGLERSR